MDVRSNPRDRYLAFIERHDIAWELGMAVLAVLFLVVGFIADDPSASPAFGAAETALTVVFVAEFTTRIAASYNRAGYLHGHWIDLVALVPVAREVRLLRLLRLLRLVRAFAGVYRALGHIGRIVNHRGLGLLITAWLGVMVICSAALYPAENGINQAITSPLDALWWGVVTLTTVGYGDVYPVTPEGRLAAGALMLLGIGLFGAITATITSYLIATGKSSAVDPLAQLRELARLRDDGTITEAEFATAKAVLLAAIDSSTTSGSGGIAMKTVRLLCLVATVAIAVGCSPSPVAAPTSVPQATAQTGATATPLAIERQPTPQAGSYYMPPGWDGVSDVNCKDFDTHAHAMSLLPRGPAARPATTRTDWMATTTVARARRCPDPSNPVAGPRRGRPRDHRHADRGRTVVARTAISTADRIGPGPVGNRERLAVADPYPGRLARPETDPRLDQPERHARQPGDDDLHGRLDGNGSTPERIHRALKLVQIAEYGYADRSPSHYQEDHLVPLEVGGAPRDPKNLWPEPNDIVLPDGTEVGSGAKDHLEDYLHMRVCAGTMALGDAQRLIAGDWIAAWIDTGRP